VPWIPCYPVPALCLASHALVIIIWSSLQLHTSACPQFCKERSSTGKQQTASIMAAKTPEPPALNVEMADADKPAPPKELTPEQALALLYAGMMAQ
jgi:hypothetical protein